MNFVFREIKTVFSQAGIPDFERLPPSKAECKKFAVLFRKFNSYLEAAKVQGFRWKKLEYTFENEDSNTEFTITLDLDETAFLVLVKRYKELFGQGAGQGGGDVPYDIEGYITTIDTDKIDTDYMNSRFDKYLKLLHTGGAGSEELKQAEDELHRTFATLSQEEQKFANIFIHDIQSGDVEVDPSKSFRDYVTDYVSQAKNDQIHRVALVLGLDEAALRKMMAQRITEDNINEFGRFDALKATVDKAAAKAYFEALTGQKLIPPKVNIRVDSFLREFIVKGGFDIEDQSDTTVQTVHQAQYYDDSAYSTMKQAAEPSADIS